MNLGGEGQVLLGELHHEVGVLWGRELLRLVRVLDLEGEGEAAVPLELRALLAALQLARPAAVSYSEADV